MAEPAKPRIGIVVDTMEGNGAERVALTLITHLLQRGYQVDLLLCRMSGALLPLIPDAVRLFTVNTKVDLLLFRIMDIALRLMPCSVRIARWTARDLMVKLSALRPVLARRPVYHCGPCWSGRLIAYIRVAVMLRWPWKQYAHVTFQMARATLSIAHYMDKEQPRVILAMLPKSKISTLLARRFSKIRTRVVLAIHNTMANRRESHRLLAKVLFHEADAITTVSHDLADDFSSATDIPRERVATIWNPVDVAALQSLAVQEPDHPWLKASPREVVLATGRLIKRKDFPTLLRAFARLETFPNLRLVILGEGPERSALKNLAAELGIGERVDFPGWVPNPYALMSRCKLFVLSSVGEGFPMSLIEAAACGCRIVSTDCPTGPREILENGKYGALVSVGDDVAMAEAMVNSIKQDPDGDALRRHVECVSVENVGAAYEKILLESV